MESKPRLTRVTNAAELAELMAHQDDLGTPRLAWPPDQFYSDELRAWRAAQGDSECSHE